jgi:dCTP deaminase
MGFWTSEQIKEFGEKLLEPFKSEQVVNCAVELTMGREAFVTGGKPAKKVILTSHDSQVVIPPGQFALLLSHEKVKIPLNAIGFISVRSRLKLLGLVNVSGFHVDPGFEGKLIFAVYNAGGNSIPISRGQRVFLLWLSSLEGETADGYNGSHKNQDSISNDAILAIGQVEFSPSAMNERLNALQHEQIAFPLSAMHEQVSVLQHQIGTIHKALISVGVGVVILLLSWLLPDRISSQPNPQSPVTPPAQTVVPSPNNEATESPPGIRILGS